MKKVSECEIKYNNNICTQSENGKRISFTADSSFHYSQVQIDGYVFENQADGKRCDWLFLFPSSKKEKINQHLRIAKPMATYVELKGNDHKSICEQLYKAIDKTKAQISTYDIRAIAVTTKGQQPEMKTSEYFRKVNRLIRKEVEIKKVHKRNKFTYSEKID